jgi:hypothetical protein
LVDSPAQTPTNWSILNVGLGFVPENVANKSTNVNLGTSNTLYPTQNAVKAYVDGKPVPTLDEVLTAGNTSNLEIGVGKINVFDAGFSTFGQVAFNADTYTFLDSLPNDIFSVKDGEINIFSNAGTIAAKIESNLLSVSRTFNLPNKNGTFAMLDDITTGVEGVTGFGVDNTDPLNPIVNKFTQTLNLTATGTNRATAAPITSVFTRVNNGIANRGVLLPSLTNVGDKYFIYNTTDTVKKLYADVDVYANGSLVDTFISGLTLLPGSVYSFTCMIGGIITASQEQITPYLVFRALLTQSGTSAPVLTILENNLQDIPTPSYFSQGNFLITFLNNIYTGSKTFIKIGSTSPAYTDSAAIAYVYGGSGTEIMVNTRAGGANVNDALLNTSLEILVYP